MPFLATASQQGNNATGMLILLLPLLLIGLLFWQQRRRQKQMQRAQSELLPGQQVSTTSGLRGRLMSIDEQTAEIEAAPGVVLTFDKRAVLPTQAPATTEDAAEEPADDSAEEPTGDREQESASNPDADSDQPRQGGA